MYKIQSFNPMKLDKATRKQVFIDQTPAMRFGVNQYGFLRSDRSLLVEAANRGDNKQVDEIYSMMSRNVVNAGVDTSGMSDSQILDTILPNWAQSPAELRACAQMYADRHRNDPEFQIKQDKVVSPDPPVDPVEPVEPKS